MTQYYNISHNTAYTRGVPEIYEIVQGMVEEGRCPSCGVDRRQPSGDLKVRLGKTRARFWPDALACGDYPCFVVSERMVQALRQTGIRLELGGRVEFVTPNISGLSLHTAPSYYWIDGAKHRAGKMDFEASGFVDTKFCPICGTRSDNIELTYDRQNYSDPPPPYVFTHDLSIGHDLFTTDLSPTAYFCTERVLDCARQHRLTNLSFCPVEQGVMGKHVKYWRSQKVPPP